jgi:hypothetical protein
LAKKEALHAADVGQEKSWKKSAGELWRGVTSGSSWFMVERKALPDPKFKGWHAPLFDGWVRESEQL